MPEPDIADMEGFLSHIELVLPVLGFDFLKSKPQIRVVGEVACNTSPVFEYSSGEATQFSIRSLSIAPVLKF